MARVECLPIGSVPHVSRLYTEYLSHFERVSDLYRTNSSQGLEPVEGFPQDRRQLICDVLSRQNSAWGASPATQNNIERLRAGAPAIVTGQQVALFGGPLFTLLKAATVIKLAGQFGGVPIFWLATEDHDLAEVSSVNVLTGKGELQRIDLAPVTYTHGAPVGSLPLGEAVRSALAEVSALFGECEVTQLLSDCYQPQATFSSSFARLFARLFARHGLVLIDASAPEFHRLAVPLLRDAVSRSAELTQALLERNGDLEKRGYEAQVKVTKTSTLLFDMRSGARLPIMAANGGFAIAGVKISPQALADSVARQPEAFSPSALFRPVMQDYLLPTLAYVGGPAEIAYFAQSQVIYTRLLGRVTPVLPRISATVLESKVAHQLAKYRLETSQAFLSRQELHQLISTRALPLDVNSEFERAQFQLGDVLSRLSASLHSLDPTLLEASQRAASKISYQLSRLQTRAGTALARRDQEIARHAARISSTLYPRKSLQERVVAGASFLARLGPEFTEVLVQELRLDCPGHQLLWL